jgi:hypothetical protein
VVVGIKLDLTLATITSILLHAPAVAADGDKKKRKCFRKETYSSYIYKGQSYPISNFIKFLTSLVQY